VALTALCAATLFWWLPNDGSINVGDHLSKILVERIVNQPVASANFSHPQQPLLFCIGSILEHAQDRDLVWGSGFLFRNQNTLPYKILDVRAVRGPLTRQILISHGISCPEVYGDPALLFPLYFPEFKKEDALYDYIIIPHIAEMYLFLPYKNVVFPTEPWDVILNKILKSKLVISSSLHGIVLAEAFGIPARMLHMNLHTSLFKFQDYYLGTGRQTFQYATSVHQALQLQGEPPPQIDLKKLAESFPFDYFTDDYR
jgi:pyruvyltransferase